MYSNIYELPSQVLASLDTKDAEKWLKAYNKQEPKTPEEIKEAKRKAWMACKDLPSSFSFRIKATVDNIDRDREIIDVGSVKEHMDSYIDYGGNVQWEHGGYNVATIWDWKPIKVDGRDGVVVWGNVFGGDLVYDQMRKAFVEGKNSLSVAGEAAPGKFQCDERGCYTRRNVKQLMEISLCAVPANNLCKMEWYNENARVQKSASAKSEMRFNVDEYEIHKTYNECPILSLKKSLEDIGYETRATNAGVFVKMDEEHFQKALPYMYANNLHVIRLDDDTVCLNDADYLTELSFKKGYEEGFINADGEILSSIKKSDFEVLYDRDVVMQCADGKYRLRGPWM